MTCGFEDKESRPMGAQIYGQHSVAAANASRISRQCTLSTTSSIMNRGVLQSWEQTMGSASRGAIGRLMLNRRSHHEKGPTTEVENVSARGVRG